MPHSSQGLHIALKRPYDTTKTTGKKRYNFADESRKVLTEGTLLGWADSLLRFSYDFIDDFITAQSPVTPPFPIPRLRFVQAAIAYPDQTLHRPATYLLEELIPVDLPFIKYIHNADATPLQDEHEPGYDLGVFLCFVQHVQFIITHGQVYLSNFQGAENLLTDPQVMTHPSLAEEEHFRNLFGEGNVKKAFNQFTCQHKCNKYCEWFQLESLQALEEGGTASGL
ncbi:hypothetical protein B0H34DRAFT_667849 [Crassisporium funariophilum]|nr:hypothetical protein B0H34DRAFT_667849 [Crassisporium funariophilum]